MEKVSTYIKIYLYNWRYCYLPFCFFSILDTITNEFSLIIVYKH